GGACRRRPHVLRGRGRRARGGRARAGARLPRPWLPPRLSKAMAVSSDIAAVVFDLDGVLVDSEQLWDDVRENLARERGGRWHDGAQADMMGMSSPEWSRYMHDVIGLAESPEEINAEVVRRLLARYERELPLLPGAVAAVERLSERWPLGVASSS